MLLTHHSLPVARIEGQIIHTPNEKPRAGSSMKMACHRSQVASHSPLAGEEPRLSRAQLIALQHTEDCTPLAQRQLKNTQLQSPAANGDET
jgi:hypothetical protein